MMLIEKVVEYHRSKIKQYPVNSNRASQAGHPCLRYLVFERTKWQEKILHNVELQMIFAEGNLHERAVLNDLAQVGIQVIEQQKSFAWKEFQLTGHIDGKVMAPEFGKYVPLEIKSMSDINFRKINSEADMRVSKYPYMISYPGQLQLYMLLDNNDRALMITKNKTNGQLKEIPFILDYDYAEGILKRLEQVNKHVAEGTIPDEPWKDYCLECAYLHLSHPDKAVDALALVEDSDLEQKLDHYYELEPAKKEAEALWEEVKEQVKGREGILKSYILQGKWVENKGYVKEVKPFRYWLPKIKHI